MRYISVCSGIEAATVAWHPLGWEAAAFAEIEKFPSAVLAHHYPNVPNQGDFTTIKGDEYGAVDALVGGTPCQDFSVAGLRAGMDGERGQLTVEFARLAGRLRPRWLVWENVPGVLSIDGGRAFGTFLGLLGELGYGFAYRILDAQFFGVPQRRRRVFVAGYLGDWRRAAAVLFERHSLSGYPAPRREAGQSVAGSIGCRAGSRGDLDGHGAYLACSKWAADVAPTLNAHFGDKMGLEDQHTLNGAGMFVTHSLRADGFDASEDGTGRGTPLVTSFVCQLCGEHFSDPHAVEVGGLAPAECPRCGEEKRVIAFSAKDYGADADEIAPTLRAGGFDKSHANAGVMPAVAFNLCGRQGGAMPEADDLASMRATSGGSSRSYIAASAVRRLTPRECERLMGFPDYYTLVPFRGKPAADGPRYKALGNSMAVPVMRWIGERIQMVEEL